MFLSSERQEGLPLANPKWQQPTFLPWLETQDSRQSACGWVFHTLFHCIFLMHGPQNVTAENKHILSASFLASSLPSSVSPESNLHSASPHQPQVCEEMSWAAVEFHPEYIECSPAGGTQHLKGVDGWMLKKIVHRPYAKWLGPSLIFFFQWEFYDLFFFLMVNSV